MPTSNSFVIDKSSQNDELSTKVLRPREVLSGLKSIDTDEIFPSVYGYEILSVVGSGGMGIVYQARHLALNRIVALKLLRGVALSDPDYRERFHAEAEAVARLQHPNIIQVFEVGVTDQLAGQRFSNPFIALEFVDGGSLAQKTNKPQSPRYAAEMVEKLARAVHSAHQQGVIHRDLKPANVLLTCEGEPKIADFGIAKQVGGDGSNRFMTMDGTVMGTPEYMAPEQSAGKFATPATDIYQLGVILYELLAARVPFQGATPLETMTFSQHQEPVSPRRFKPDLSRDLETICLKCLEKNPNSRYSSAEALANDLRSFLDGRTIQARRVGEWEKVARWCKRNPSVTGSLAGIVLTVLIALVVISRSYWRAELAWHNESIQRQEAERREQAERWERYRANITATASSLELYDMGGARRNLEATPEEYRNWEWRHFNTRVDLAQTTLTLGEATGEVGVISGNGDRVLLSGSDKAIRVYDSNSGNLLRKLTETSWPDHSQISHDGKWLAIPLANGDIDLRNVDEKDDGPRKTLKGLVKSAKMIGFSADGTRLAAAANHTVLIWDTLSGKIISTFRPFESDLHAVGFSPDGSRVAVSQHKTFEVQLWNAETGRLVAVLPGHERGISYFGFNRQGTRLVSCTGFPSNTIRMWNAENGELIHVLKGHENSVKKCIFSSDGSRLATCSLDQTIRLWKIDSGAPIAVLTGHKGWVNNVAFSPDGTRLISASQDHTLRLWDGHTGVPLNVLVGHTMEIVGVNYTPDGNRIVSCSRDDTARLWDAKKIESDGVLRGHTKFVYSIAYHQDGKRLVSAAWDGTVRVWDTTTSKQLAVMDHGKNAIAISVAIHPDGNLIASRTLEAVILWDLDSGKEVHRWNVPSDPWRHTRLCFSLQGDLLATGGPENTVHLLDVKARTEVAIFRGHNDTVRDVVFSPDGKFLLSAGEESDNTVRVWSISEKKEVQRLEGHSHLVYALGMSKDGKVLASGSYDGTVRLWDTATWKEIAVLKHGTYVYSIAFTPDGKRLACGCANNSIRLWDLATRQEIVDLRGHNAYVHSVVFSPDGNRLVSGSGDFTIRVWDTNRP